MISPCIRANAKIWHSSKGPSFKYTVYFYIFGACVNASHRFCIQLSVIGTPDEEDDSGKVRIIDREAFVGVDAAIMAYPWNVTVVPIPGFVALSPLVVFDI